VKNTKKPDKDFQIINRRTKDSGTSLNIEKMVGVYINLKYLWLKIVKKILKVMKVRSYAFQA